jgi:hypothetical protein
MMVPQGGNKNQLRLVPKTWFIFTISSGLVFEGFNGFNRFNILKPSG